MADVVSKAAAGVVIRETGAVRGQTLSQIRQLLAEAGVRPSTRLGQRFLIDLNLMRKVIRTAKVAAGDVVLEIGAGTGSLTGLLLEAGARVVAVEIDRRLAALLRRRIGEHPRLTLLEIDALAGKNRLNPAVLMALRARTPEVDGTYKLVANLPYQIATPVLMELLALRPPLHSMTCTVQREVAERLLAEPGRSDYGPASVITHLACEARLVTRLPASAFWPRPRVESALLHLTPHTPEQVGVEDLADLARFVRDAFTQRRKKLRHALRGLLGERVEAVLETCGISANLRPDQVPPCDWLRLYRRTRPQVGK